MKQDQEMEKKYLITGEEIFKELLALLRPLDSIDGHILRNFSSKLREYRYFDTFEGKLAEGEILTYIGPLEREGASTSVRARETDYVLTVKIPTEMPGKREEKEYHFTLPSGTNLYRLNPEEFTHFWEPLRQVKEIGGGNPLQEAVRLVVQTNRFDLYKDNERRIEIAVDDVLGKGPFNIQKKFYELEIEHKEGTDLDSLETVANFFLAKYPSQLVESLLPKWIKALRLIRGEKLEDLATKSG